MDYIAGALFILDLLILGAYRIFKPDYGDERAMTLYSVTMVGLSMFVSGIFFLWMKNTYEHTQYGEWWFFMGLCGSFLIFFVLMIIVFLIRMWMFRSKSKNHFSGW